MTATESTPAAPPVLPTPQPVRRERGPGLRLLHLLGSMKLAVYLVLMLGVLTWLGTQLAANRGVGGRRQDLQIAFAQHDAVIGAARRHDRLARRRRVRVLGVGRQNETEPFHGRRGAGHLRHPMRDMVEENFAEPGDLAEGRGHR
jgi:hypothetical protein